MTAIVGVHGVGNYIPGQPADKVAARRSADWAASVAAGLGTRPDALDLTVCYYAPLLHAGQPTAQAAATDPDRALDTLDPDTQALAASWIQALDLPEVTVQGRLAVPLRHAVAAAADRFSLDGRLTKLFVAICFPEVARYLAADDAAARAQARDHVAATIASRQARIVIAHSLGTVVAYEALHAHPDLDVDLLVTLGSPLALPDADLRPPATPAHRHRPAPGQCPSMGQHQRPRRSGRYPAAVQDLLPRRRPGSHRKRLAVRLPPRRPLPGLRLPRRHSPAAPSATMTLSGGFPPWPGSYTVGGLADVLA